MKVKPKRSTKYSKLIGNAFLSDEGIIVKFGDDQKTNLDWISYETLEDFLDEWERIE